MHAAPRHPRKAPDQKDRVFTMPTSIIDQPTTTATIVKPTTDTAPPLATGLTADSPFTTASRSVLQVLDRIGRAVFEAGSLPSHPFLAQAVSPNGAGLWVTASGLHTPAHPNRRTP